MDQQYSGGMLSVRYIIAALALTIACSASAKRPMKHLKHVVLDPGHGGSNTGTPGSHGVYEKYLTLPIALKVEALLRKRTNTKVTLTRRSDTFVGLRDRTRIANKAKGDLLLSIHCNASLRERSHGLEVYFLSNDSSTEEIARHVAREQEGHHAGAAGAPSTKNTPASVKQLIAEAQMHRSHQDAEQAAVIMLDRLHKRLKAPRRGVFQAPFAVLKEAEMPALVVEVGFLTHKREGKRLLTDTYQNKIAEGIYEAIIDLDSKLSLR